MHVVSRRGVAIPFRRFLLLATLCLVTATTTGCFTLECTLDRDGGGRMTLTYGVQSHARLPTERRKLEAPGIEIRDVRWVDPPGEPLALFGRFVRLQLGFDDVARLPETYLFEDVSIDRRDQDDGHSDFVASVENGGRLPRGYRREAAWELIESILEQVEPPARISITFPGDVIDSNADEVETRTATWHVPMATLFARELFTFSASYRSARAG